MLRVMRVWWVAGAEISAKFHKASHLHCVAHGTSLTPPLACPSLDKVTVLVFFYFNFYKVTALVSNPSRSLKTLNNLGQIFELSISVEALYFRALDKYIRFIL